MRKLLVLMIGVAFSTMTWAGDKLQIISKKIATDIKRNPPLSLVVLTFPYTRERFSTGSHLVSERLITYLVQDGVTVIERRLLEKLLEEKRLWQTGIMGNDALRDMGQFVGADVIVTGLLSDLSDSATEIMARAIRVDTGEVISEVSSVIQRIWNDSPRLPRIAQPRSAMPVALFPTTNEKIPLTSGHVGKKSERYYPAAVPFLNSNVLQLPKGGTRK